MRATTGSHARFSSCGYTRSKQCVEPPAEREKLHRLNRHSIEMAKKKASDAFVMAQGPNQMARRAAELGKPSKASEQ